MLQYHILNGDALKQQFPKKIEGSIIIARECMVDGDVKGQTIDDIFAARSQFITSNYGDCTKQEYYQKTVTEFEKIKSIPEEAEIILWFEDDLFCQVNMWFTIYYLNEHKKNNKLFLVRPLVHTSYGFGGFDADELFELYENKVELKHQKDLVSLWISYQNNDIDSMMQIAKDLEICYPFILKAVEAHIQRIPTSNYVGRPKQVLLQIMNDLNTDQFGPVFREFCKRESIYGFGDLQVKRLFDELVTS